MSKTIETLFDEIRELLEVTETKARNEEQQYISDLEAALEGKGVLTDEARVRKYIQILFSNFLMRHGEHKLSNAVMDGTDNSHAGQAAVETMMALIANERGRCKDLVEAFLGPRQSLRVMFNPRESLETIINAIERGTILPPARAEVEDNTNTETEASVSEPQKSLSRGRKSGWYWATPSYGQGESVPVKLEVPDNQDIKPLWVLGDKVWIGDLPSEYKLGPYIPDLVQQSKMYQWHLRAVSEPVGAGWETIESAPKDGKPTWVYVAMAHGLPPFEDKCSWHPDAGWCADELRPVTHWHPELTKILRDAERYRWLAENLHKRPGLSTITIEALEYLIDFEIARERQP